MVGAYKAHQTTSLSPVLKVTIHRHRDKGYRLYPLQYQAHHRYDAKHSLLGPHTL